MLNHPDIGISMNNLAEILKSLNRLKAVEKTFTGSSKFSKTKSLPNNPEIVNSNSNLASVIHHLGRLVEAKVLLRKALNLRKSNF